MLSCCLQHPGSTSQTEAGDMETDGVDSDDDNDVLKSEQVCLFCCSTACLLAAQCTLPALCLTTSPPHELCQFGSAMTKCYHA